MASRRVDVMHAGMDVLNIAKKWPRVMRVAS